jgi:hypothetical protein
MKKYYHKNSPTLIYCPPKCGNVTLEFSGYFQDEEKPVKRKILLIRDPMERFVSGYLYLLFQNKIRLKRGAKSADHTLKYTREGFSIFVNEHLYYPVINRWYDIHVEPQINFHKRYPVPLDDVELIETKNLSKLMKSLEPGWEPQILNRSQMKFIFPNEDLFENCRYRWNSLFEDDIAHYKKLRKRLDKTS